MKWSFYRRNDLNFLTLSRGIKTVERERQHREIRVGQDDIKAETDFCPATPTQVLIPPAGVGQCKKIPPKVAPKPRKDSNYRAIHLKAQQCTNILNFWPSLDCWVNFHFFIFELVLRKYVTDILISSKTPVVDIRQQYLSLDCLDSSR